MRHVHRLVKEKKNIGYRSTNHSKCILSKLSEAYWNTVFACEKLCFYLLLNPHAIKIWRVFAKNDRQRFILCSSTPERREVITLAPAVSDEENFCVRINTAMHARRLDVCSCFFRTMIAPIQMKEQMFRMHAAIKYDIFRLLTTVVVWGAARRTAGCS